MTLYSPYRVGWKRNNCVWETPGPCHIFISGIWEAVT